ncbi:hypothetical protein AVEN_49143-1 [Araneus ventricosus]|uniref:DDE-1 domain-containing protein n=1 Tax=Araneus ventricosus TaxID=182803 RepID=A0A4Y2BZZ0_ARAVE|nr:hypothetical protein AVEN_49143-1 [Araneus ventricosus]
MDQCTVHLQEPDSLQNLKITFFPANCTSKLQPLDLGIIKKRRFPDLELDECDINDENNVCERDAKTVVIDVEDWNILRAEIILQEYENCNTDNMISELFTIDELIEDKLSDANLNDGEECEEVIPPSFNGARYCIEKLQFYFICPKTNAKSLNELNSIPNAVINIHRKLAHQMTVI